jgi:hypothetical protein
MQVGVVFAFGNNDGCFRAAVGPDLNRHLRLAGAAGDAAVQVPPGTPPLHSPVEPMA